MFAMMMGVLGWLSDAVEGLDPSTIGSSPGALAELLALVDRLRAVATVAVGAFDANGSWGLDSATSATAWLKAWCGLSGSSAAGLAGLARRLRSMPVTASAWVEGRLSGDQVRAIVACVDADLVGLFGEAEEALVEVLAPLSVRDVSSVMQHWRERARATRPDPRPAAERRSLRLSALPDGTWRLDADLLVEGGALVDRAIRSATSSDADGEPVRTAPQRRADALVDVCRWFLDHQASPPTARCRPHLDVAAAAEDLAEEGPGRTADGSVVDAATLQRLACDASISRLLVRGRSHVLDYGTATRVVPAALFLALVARDRHCRWPGCDRSPDWCDAHHVRHWAHGGATALGNLVLLCSRHHHLIHQPGVRVRLDPADAGLAVLLPDGRVVTSRPPPILEQLNLADTG